eukprot:SAG31_NODE_379_length_16485_cov_3.654583_15_plen_82_part_00
MAKPTTHVPRRAAHQTSSARQSPPGMRAQRLQQNFAEGLLSGPQANGEEEPAASPGLVTTLIKPLREKPGECSLSEVLSLK